MTLEQELIEKLEKAAGPSRELDRLIEETLPGVLRHPYRHSVEDGYVISGEEHPHHDPGQGYLPPHYTKSIDDALTLMPQDWCLLLAWKPTLTVCDVHSRPLGDPFGAWPANAKAPTPAIALCIAALKARAAHSKGERR